jgi:rod shape-determining protein MreC
MSVQMLSDTANLKPGYRLVTDFRLDSTFAGGVPVGVLTSVRGTVASLQRVAFVRPYVNFTALDLVGVIVDNPRTDPRDSVLPPKPVSTPGVVPTPAGSSCGSPAVAATTQAPAASPSSSSTGSPSGGATGSPNPNPSASHSP